MIFNIIKYKIIFIFIILFIYFYLLYYLQYPYIFLNDLHNLKIIMFDFILSYFFIG